MGVLGSAMLATWSFLDPDPALPSPITARDVAEWVLGGAGMVAVTAAWLRSRRLPGRRLVTAAAWSVPMLFCPPLLSRDGWAYAAQGWMLVNGLNPYTVPQGLATDLGRGVDVAWSGSTAVYPPGSLWLQALMVWLAHAHPFWSVVAMRGPSILGLVLIALTVPRLARLTGVDADAALWLAVCNPLTLLNLVGGMHNDGLQVGLTLLALTVAGRMARDGRGWAGLVVGGVLVGLSGSVKQTGVLAGMGLVAVVHVATVRRADGRASLDRTGLRARGWTRENCWRGLLARLVVGAVPAIAAFVAVSSVRGLWFGWLNASAGSPASVTSDAPIALIVQVIRMVLDVPVSRLVGPATVISLVLVLVVLVACWLRWGPVPGHGDREGRLGDPMVMQAGVLAAFAVLGVSLQPWYLIGPLALLAVSRRNHPDIVVLGIVGCVAVEFLQWFCSPFVALPVVALGMIVVWRVGWLRTALTAGAGGRTRLADGRTQPERMTDARR